MSHRSFNTAVRCVAVVAFALAAGAASEAGQPVIELHPLVSGFDRPVVITHPGDHSGRIFVVEQTGAIRIVAPDGTLLPQAFLDLDPQSACCGEQGVLGLAFHPDYESNGLFYVHYSDNGGDTVISRFTVTGDPNLADPISELQLLTVDQPYSNHNGGQIEFGPDGYLYIGLGDGGSAGDPGDRAQNPALLLGKLLRIDVDAPSPPLNYSIPPDNPFVGVPGAAGEIWSLGLRNPWRFSFDRATGDLFIGDVGQNAWEEVDFQAAASSGGENWGWRCYEGEVPYNTSGCGPIGDYDLPILTYAHAAGNCSINGGYRYRGANHPNLVGTYLYGDYCSGKIWGATFDGATWSSVELFDMPAAQSTFGQDEDGELLVAAYASAPSGTVYRILDLSISAEIFSDDFESGTTSNWTTTTP